MADALHLPFSEILKSIPGFFGIRLEEQPRFEVVERLGEVEVRRYARACIAEVTLPGSHDEAIDQGFDRLARYIFGENQSGTRLSMTSPVEQREAGAVGRRDGSDGWVIGFFLGNDLDPAEAPVPKDPGIRLVAVPERTLAATAYSGNNTAEGRASARERLVATLSGASRWRMDGPVFWAQFDAPFVIPFLKKNEALVPVAPTDG